MKYYYNPEVKYLLIPYSDEMEKLNYGTGKNMIGIPKIGRRPPYYFNPRYKQYFPII